MESIIYAKDFEMGNSKLVRLIIGISAHKIKSKSE